MGAVNFTTFWTNLETLEKAIAISSPVALKVKRAYWGAPQQEITDLPCVINALSETDRILGFGSRDQNLRINVQLLVASATVEDTYNALKATSFWFAAKDAFDEDITIGSTVSFSTLRGADPTVPVILTHGGRAYIGFNAYLDVQDVEDFTFG